MGLSFVFRVQDSAACCTVVIATCITMFVEYTLAFLAFFTSSTLATGNLFDNGQLGLVLGSQFGLAGTNATYDYVVVGGGTAGLTIATRLAEDPSVSVAVIEAGGFYELDNGNLSVIPGGATFYTGANATNYQPLIDWGFSTVPQAVRIPLISSLPVQC